MFASPRFAATLPVVFETASARTLLCIFGASPARSRSHISSNRGYRLASTRLAYYSTGTAAAAMDIQLSAPNGRSWTQPVGLFINNEFVPSSNGQKLATINPTTEEEICSVHAATREDIHKAVTAARAALKSPAWRYLSGTQRGALLSKLADLASAHAAVLATIETLDSGKPYSVALASDVARFCDVLRYYAGFADKNFGRTIDTGRGRLAYTVPEPLGVCAQIIPWNYPLEMAAWKIAPALACGNAVVLKPSEWTPLSALYLAALVCEAGFPPGVVNIVNGHGREAGTALVEHEMVDKVAFTGSTATGKEIMRLASRTLKNITLETGGKSPLLVFEDANIKQAARWAHAGIMSNSGQVCTANSRLLVHEAVMDEFVAEFTKIVKEVSIVGDPFDETTFQGPQVSRQQYDKIMSYIESGLEQGARLVTGGKPTKTASSKGFFIEPTLFAGVTSDMKICREEIFGPCAVVQPFKSEEQAVAMANDSAYGLGAMVFTRDLARAHRVAGEVEAGMVFVNSCDDSDVRAPFGGVKQSGIGRELGEEGMRAYCNVKTVHVNLTDE